MRNTSVVALLVVLLATGSLFAQQTSRTVPPNLPEGKRTVLGLYVTAKGAYEKWKADPQNVKIIDVRTPEEYVFVGHPPMARHVPFLTLEHAWDPQRGRTVMKPNPDFVARIRRVAKPGETLLLICRSGGRSASAVNALAKAGWKNVYTVIDGFEGDTVKDPESVFHGKRMKNGWKNSGGPWTYDVNPKLMVGP